MGFDEKPSVLNSSSAASMRRLIRHIIVAPIYENERRIGSRVWADCVELDEYDPRFREAVIGKLSYQPLVEAFPL